MHYNKKRVYMNLFFAYALSFFYLVNASEGSDSDDSDKTSEGYCWPARPQSDLYFALDPMGASMLGMYGVEEVNHTIAWDTHSNLMAEGKLEKEPARAGRNQRYKLARSDSDQRAYFFEEPDRTWKSTSNSSLDRSIKPSIFLKAASVKFYWSKEHQNGSLYAEIEVTDDPLQQFYMNPESPHKRLRASLLFMHKGLGKSPLKLKEVYPD